ncbi:hypothetical protein P7K49_038772, partial [Saguinus oedipus]
SPTAIRIPNPFLLLSTLPNPSGTPVLSGPYRPHNSSAPPPDPRPIHAAPVPAGPIQVPGCDATDLPIGVGGKEARPFEGPAAGTDRLAERRGRGSLRRQGETLREVAGGPHRRETAPNRPLRPLRLERLPQVSRSHPTPPRGTSQWGAGPHSHGLFSRRELR